MTPPIAAVKFTQLNGFWYWQLSNSRYQSVVDWRYWLSVYGGEKELDVTVVGDEPSDSEYAMMMGW